jgi:hypothetical protein
MLAIPEDVSSCAKLRSPAAVPSGTPSSRIWLPDAPNNRPVSPLSFRDCRSSFQVVSNCAAVRTCPNSYNRANFNRMFRLRTKPRAVDRVSPFIFPRISPGYTFFLPTLGCNPFRNKHPATICTHLTNRCYCSGTAALVPSRSLLLGCPHLLLLRTMF